MSSRRETHRWRASRAEIGPGLTVARALPRRGRRCVGAWCFLDHFGPLEVGDGGGMDVGPHPHIGLQTVTWLFEGSLLHRDSLGHEQLIQPGELNLMTSGAEGIVHSERMPDPRPRRLHGVQLWVALPAGGRGIDPAFEHHATLPALDGDGCRIQVFLGEVSAQRAPGRSQARSHSPLVGAQVDLRADAKIELAVDGLHEHAVFLVHGTLQGDVSLSIAEEIEYLPSGRETIVMQARTSTRAILIGGPPLDHPIHMWWNYVADDRELIRRAAADWSRGRRFEPVPGDDGVRIEGPLLPEAY